MSKNQIIYPPTSVPNISLLCQDESSCTVSKETVFKQASVQGNSLLFQDDVSCTPVLSATTECGKEGILASFSQESTHMTLCTMINSINFFH
ncbi:homeobox protein 13-related [Anaeramoeba flamelloides]|uniref:Homeobox protein 13-related n=1 Tax=Anaeramoeba flamelloides TaxID=1746091 RepID=A0AAV7YYU3_9EUKA|nr:homeobox protein 13-related [Anaeramoeba flamelloides]